jgi:BirA family biotin operon repressor/biotin-[acetyl-CoA-carboxylase] ligase
MMYDGLDPGALAARLRLPRVVVLERTTSTMDEAHALAANAAPGGTLVLAHVQTQGRGRSGARWIGVEGKSILCTLIERPSATAVLDVLSLRVGLGIAAALDVFADHPVGVKWPNDLMLEGGKFAGILIEARWRDGLPDWVAIAAGVNVGEPPGDIEGSRGLRAETSRLAVLDAIIPAMREAATKKGPLTAAEVAAWHVRDHLDGRRVRAPVIGVVRGILPTGEVQIETPDGLTAVRSGSITLEDE